MKYSELRKILRRCGCIVVRQGANHEIWFSPKTGRKFPVARHDSWEGIDSVDALLEGLAEIQEKGISTTIFREHMLGVGVPVLVGGWPIASIGMCLPRFRCSESRLGIIHEVLDECAASIAEKVRSAYYSG